MEIQIALFKDTYCQRLPSSLEIIHSRIPSKGVYPEWFILLIFEHKISTWDVYYHIKIKGE
ncbi:hypothetical protein CJ483_16720 [Bacillus sp. PK3_68]|nr:hypothetical protein CJ483_16720 [Bacillus sp. PK3_68]